MNIPPDYPRHTTAEAAAILGLPQEKVRKAAERRGLGTLKTARLRLLSDNDLEQLRSTMREGPGNPEFGTAMMAKKAVAARKKAAKARKAAAKRSKPA